MAKAKRKKNPLVLNSFTYKKYATEAQKLDSVRLALIENKLIDKETESENFLQIFSGQVVEAPIVWKGNRSELWYFIMLFYDTFKLVKDLKQNQWLVATKCFVPDDGTIYSRWRIRGHKRPKLTGNKIDEIMELMR